MEATLSPDKPGRETHQEARSYAGEVQEPHGREPHGFGRSGVVGVGVGGAAAQADGQEGERHGY